MNFWISLLGYQAVWFCTVIGAGHDLVWPGVLGFAVYASWQLSISGRRRADLQLIGTAIVLAIVVDGGLLRAGLVHYAADRPIAGLAPAWIIALWATFALTFTQSLKYLQCRLGLALLLGLVGGPLAYLGAQRAQAVTLAQPTGISLLWLGIAWALAMPLLASLALRWTANAAKRGSALSAGALRGGPP